MREIMVAYVMKIPPKMLDRIKKEAMHARDPRRPWKRRMTASAYIRRAIQRDFDHADRSRDRGGITRSPESK